METCDNSKQKRKFSDGWLSDDRYKHWIEKVPFDETLFYCNICNKSFSCSSHVSRHVDSACHKNNIKENAVPGKDTVQNKKAQYKRTFKAQWLDIEIF